jgi:hypothetical protein
MTCTKCNSEIVDEYRYCSNCGHNLILEKKYNHFINRLFHSKPNKHKDFFITYIYVSIAYLIMFCTSSFLSFIGEITFTLSMFPVILAVILAIPTSIITTSYLSKNTLFGLILPSILFVFQFYLIVDDTIWMTFDKLHLVIMLMNILSLYFILRIFLLLKHYRFIKSNTELFSSFVLK